MLINERRNGFYFGKQQTDYEVFEWLAKLTNQFLRVQLSYRSPELMSSTNPYLLECEPWMPKQ